MPMGMCLVGEAARKAGHHVEMHDMTFQKSRNGLPQWFEKPHDIVGISMRNLDNCDARFSTSYIPDVKKITTDMRRYSSAPIVIGGPATGITPHALLQKTGAEWIRPEDTHIYKAMGYDHFKLVERGNANSSFRKESQSVHRGTL